MAQNKAALNKVKGMTREQEIAYLSTANRVTVGIISQVVEKPGGGFNFKNFYVPKIRGIFVGDRDNYKHETPDAARATGREILARWQKEHADNCGIWVNAPTLREIFSRWRVEHAERRDGEQQ
jgi:hypothetical protein